MKHGSAHEPLPGDNPIQDSGTDRLERASIAETFARQVLALDVSEGAAVGVFGLWGSGKTSFINLARNTFEAESVPVLDFNPWMFSGAEQLVDRFFSELSAEMGEENGLSEIGEAFRKYGAAFNAVAGVASTLLAVPQIGEIVRNFSEAANTASPESANALRKKIKCTLKERAKRVIVILDDVDRLSGPEIREVFKLVRLTASFPNLVYIVACDRLRVEQALEEPGLPGRDYLEKIIQFPYNLPELPKHVFRQQVRTVIAGIESLGPFDDDRHRYIYLRVVEPLLRTMRDIRRYAIAIRSTAINLEGKVELADVLGLEAVRLFLPDVFQRLHGAVDVLTVTSGNRKMEREIVNDGILVSGDWLESGDSGEHGSSTDERLKELIDAAGPRKRIVRHLIDILFPGAEMQSGTEAKDNPKLAADLLRNVRVGHEDILRFYLERLPGGEIPAYEDAERAFEKMADRDGFESFLRSLDPSHCARVLWHLADFDDRFSPEHFEPGALVILNLLPELPDRSPIDGLPLRMIAAEIVADLKRVLTDAYEIEESVRRILSGLTSVASKVELVIQVNKDQTLGKSPVVSEEVATKLNNDLCSEIRSKVANDEIADYNLARVLSFHKNYGQLPLMIPDTSEMTFRILRSAQAVMLIGAPELDWQLLTNIFGKNDALALRIEKLRQNFDELKPWLEHQNIRLAEAESILDLAEKGEDE